MNKAVGIELNRIYGVIGKNKMGKKKSSQKILNSIDNKNYFRNFKNSLEKILNNYNNEL